MLENNLNETPILVGEIQEQVIDLSKKEQEKVVEPKTEDVVVLPDDAMKVLSKVTVKGVSADIDENIKAENIKLGVTILGIEGNVAQDKPDQEKTIYPSEEEQIVVADTGFELGKVIAKPVETESFEVTPSTSEQVVKASDGKYIKEVVVEAIEDIEPEIAEQEEKLASLGVKVDDLPIDKPSQDKVVTPTNEQQTIVADEGYKLGSVIVEAQESYTEDLVAQRELIDGIEADVNELSDKPKDMLQQRVDSTNSCAYLFYQYMGENLNFIRNLDTSKATSMGNMFFGCENLTELDLSNLDTSNVESMNGMFRDCYALTTVDMSNFNTSKVTNMASMFSTPYTKSVGFVSLDLSNFDTSNVTSMGSMFKQCKKLTTLNLFNSNTGNVTNMSEMFYGCSKLTSLDLSKFDTSNVTDMSYMFYDCPSLTSLNISSFDTKKVTKMNNMFQNNSKLQNIIGKINMYNVGASYMTNMFMSCSKLESVTLLNIKKNLTMGAGTSFGTLLTNETLINTIQQLWDLTGTTRQTLTLSTASKENIANIYVKLIDVTDEMLAEDEHIASKKPCVVCESTDDGAMTLTEYATSKNWAIA